MIAPVLSRKLQQRRVENMRSKIVPSEKIPDLPFDGITITYEDKLPYKIVHYPPFIYGAFFAFQREENGNLYVCSCQKKALKAYLGYKQYLGYQALPTTLTEKPLNEMFFENNLCHVCNQVPPKYSFGMTFSRTKFNSIYGFYTQSKMLEFGVDMMGHIYDANRIPEDLLPFLVTDSYFDNRLDKQSVLDFERYCENIIRRQIGHFEIGKKWTSEVNLLEIIKRIFPKYSVVHQYELDGLKIDIFIEEMNLAIEYQGQQHFKPIGAWGGEKTLKRTQERDKLKVEICNYYNFDLIYFNYDEELTEKYVKSKINCFLTKKA